MTNASMLSRTINVSRCLTKARYHPQPCFRILHAAYSECATVVARSPLWTNQSMSLESQTDRMDQILTGMDIADHPETSGDISSEDDTKLPRLPRELHQQLIPQSPSTKASLTRRVKTRSRRARSKSRSAQHGSLRSRAPRNPIRPVYPRLRSKPTVGIVGTPRLQMQNHSSSKYLSRPRLVSLAAWDNSSRLPNKDSNGSEVGQNPAKINSQWYLGMINLQNGQPFKIWTSSVIERFVGRYGGSNRGRSLLHRFWVCCPRRYRLQRWQDLTLWCMQHSPKTALTLLTLTFKSRYLRPPRYMVEDCLTLLARHFLLDTLKADPSVLNVLWRLMCDLMNEVPSFGSQSWSVPQDAVKLLLKHCNDQQALALYEMLVSKRAHLTANTMLHFLEIFAEMGRLDLCLILLERIASDFPKVFHTGQQVQSSCVKLLRTSWGVKEPFSVQSSILSHILELGIRPNILFYNAIILTLIEGRDFDTAWRVYDMAKQNGNFWNDQITYSILSKGAKLSGDSTLLEKVIRETENRPGLINGQLICDILCAIHELSSGDAFPMMFKYYQKHLDVRPLQELGLCASEPGVIPSPEAPAADGKWPSPTILGQMILAYNHSHRSSHELIQRYNVYHDFVQHEHPLFAPLASNDYVANSFLLAFGKKPETLHYCTLVIRHMQSPPLSTNSASRAAPTVQSWNILAHSFMRHGQKRAAEKVLTMMQERGLRPDIVTWNTIISGYSALHDVGAAVGAMRRMKAAGLGPDSWTLKGLGKLGDPAKLLELLKARLGEPPELEQQTSSYEHIRQSVDPMEVEEMAAGWETNDVHDRYKEIREYVRDYRKKQLEHG